MFKKSLLVMGLAAASSTAFAATTALTYPQGGATSAATPTISVEGYATKTAAADKQFAPGAVVFDPSAAQAAAATGVITIEGGEFFDTNISLFTADASDLTSGAADITPKWTFGDVNNVKFDLTSDGISDGYVLVMSGAKIVPAAATVGSTVTAKFSISSVLKELDSATATLGKFVNQFSIAGLTKFSKKIDVQTASKSLESGESDSFSFAVKSLTTNYHSYTDGVSVAAAVTGDLSWALNTSGADVSAGLTTVGTTWTINSSAQNLAADFTPSSVSATYGLTATPSTADGTGALTAGSYSADVTVKNSAGTSTFASATVDLGSWTLNGSEITIPYMPFGSAYAQAISVTNSGTIGGEILVSFTANGTTTDAVSVGTSTAKSVVNIGKAVGSAANAADITEAQVNITVKAPSANIKTTAIYYSKADADRVNVTPK